MRTPKRGGLLHLSSVCPSRSLLALGLHRCREGKSRLFALMEQVHCLREVQGTVQLLLNQNDFPEALDVIQTAQAVLLDEFNGVVCFRCHFPVSMKSIPFALLVRHLGVQLAELHHVIGKMLQEEFVTLVEREFGRKVDSESDLNDVDVCQFVLSSSVTMLPLVQGQLHPVVMGLLRVREFRFVGVLKEEIVNSVRNIIRHLVKEHIIAFDEMTEFDPSFGNLGEQMRKLNLDQWLALLEGVFDELFSFCKHVQAVQNLILDNVDRVAGKTECPNVLDDNRLLNEIDYLELRPNVEFLTGHACISAQERVCKIVVARSKDAFLERMPTEDFVRMSKKVTNFIEKCQHLASNGKTSALKTCLQTLGSNFVARFHEDRKAKLSNILDSEHWRAAEVPQVFQQIATNCELTGHLRDVTIGHQHGHYEHTSPYLVVANERFVVVGTSLLLLQMLAQYCQTMVQMSGQMTGDLLTKLVELLKNFNSRTCQLILGAGALQLVGLKTISVRNLALASRCLQLIVYFMSFAQKEFADNLPENQANFMRHFSQVCKDYEDHIQEITNKLLSIMDHHTITCISKWEFKGSVPSPSFQQIARHLRKFHEGLTDILPNDQIQRIFLRVHDQFKTNLGAHLQKMGISPLDHIIYGMVCSEFSYYMECLRSLPCCASLNDTLNDVMKHVY